MFRSAQHDRLHVCDVRSTRPCPTITLLHSENPTRRQNFIDQGWVAQLAEQWTENPRVGGSIPPPAKALFRGEKLGNPAFFSQFPKCPEIKEIPTISSGRQQRRYSRLDQSFAPRAISAHFTYGHPRQAQCSP